MISLNSLQEHCQDFYAKHKRYVYVAGSFLFILLFRIVYFTSSNKDQVKSQAPVVIVETAKKGDLPIYFMALGSIIPNRSIVIKTQINGQLLRVLFEEGQLVKEGDLLAEIDSRPYDAQLLQYEGQLVKDKALLKNAKLDYERYKKLVKDGAISKQTLDTQKSLVEQYEGTVEYDQGLVDTVKLNKFYCSVKAPVDGRVGLRLVDPGNYVQTSDPNGIVVVNSLNPIYVVFSVAQDNIPVILEQLSKDNKLKVEAYDREQNKLLKVGTLEIVDNQIDTTTGTVKLKALFDNQDNKFFPNQFVNIRLLVDTLVDAVIVPTASVQHSPKGPFVYKLSKDQKVKIVQVVVKAVDDNMTAIISDIKPGDVVVTEGTDKLTDNSLVAPLKKSANTSNAKNTRAEISKASL